MKSELRTVRRLLREFPSLLTYWAGPKTDQGRGSVAWRLARTRQFLTCREAVLRLPELYQPILVPGFGDLAAQRPCNDRLDLIARDIEGPPGTVIDIGCQIGYFSLALSARGFCVIGYDQNAQNLQIADLLRELTPGPGPRFVQMCLEPSTAEKLELADHVLCLAVFHHIVHYYGLAAASKTMAVVRQKTKKALYFEMGQSGEPVEPWSHSLPDMGSDPLEWIASFLKNSGFTSVVALGLVPTHLSSVARYLVRAS